MAKRSERIDNDRTKHLAAPFLILAHVRTGGTFLAHALSNHSQVYCDRGETLHHLSAWRRAGIPVESIMQAIWRQDGYYAAGFRAIYRQAFHPEVWPLIERVQPKIIHLTRGNVTRQGVSFGYQQLVRQGKLPFHPVHSFETSYPEPVTVDPGVIVSYARKVRREMEQGRKRLAGYSGDVLELAYEIMTGNRSMSYLGEAATARLEGFLGVRQQALQVDLVRDFNKPMSGWFSNWTDIRAALEADGFEGLDA